MRKEYLLYKLYDHSSKRIKIDSELFQKYNVKKGLRNEDGTGVLVGLTNVGDVVGYEKDAEGNVFPIDGKLYYRGYDLNDIAKDILESKSYYLESSLMKKDYHILKSLFQKICIWIKKLL